MLEAEGNRSVRAQANPSLALLALKPRQILLARAEQSSKSTTMKKQAGGSVGKAGSLNSEQKAILLHSVLGYLQLNGFSRTLKRLLSEAQIENDSWRTCSVNLEDICINYLETGTQADTNSDAKQQGLLTDSITMKDGDSHCSVVEQTVGKKKKKKSSESESNTCVTANKFAESAKNSRERLVNDLPIDSKVDLKERERSKKHQSEQVNAQTLKEPITDALCELQADESAKKQKDKKKKKSNSVSEQLDGNVEQVQLDSQLAGNEERCQNLKPSLGDDKIAFKAEVINKKKKKKSSTNALGCDAEHSGLENVDDVLLDEKKVESKHRKRRKEDSVSEALCREVAQMSQKEDSVEVVAKRELQSSEDAIDKDRNKSKKRKRLAKAENEGQAVEKVGSEDSKRRKTEGLEPTKNSEQLSEANAVIGDNEQGGQESKGEDGLVGQNDFQNTSMNQIKVNGNGSVEEDGGKPGAQKNRRKEHTSSAEPKTINAFQRIKTDQVQFADERLQDNSYWAKDGADVGYGAKAQEILGQVRGRDFRHEKTKKKRGSYRGGQIDLQSHSVKFNYDDDD
ncbi:suppressor protein SRP40 [Diospyros lotus]|uniref:suppressor protein SRP40 n=1 Tax=Diospyros lotus TaxID=55363 RepID=UPI0022506499|nr:suppressor protein SRP40 [Diospyros lotus]